MRVLVLGRKAICAKMLRFIHQSSHEVIGVVTDSHLEHSLTAGEANRLNIPILQNDRMIEEVRDGRLAFDLGISLVYWRKIPQTLIEAARLGIINFHPAPLPDYKGTGGYNLAILEGLTQWGVSAHYVDESIDTGPIIDVERFPMDADAETAVTLEEKSMRHLLRQAKRILREVEAKGRIPTHPNIGGRYVSRREMEELKWIRPGDDIERKIRAFWFPPYRGAQIEVGGKTFTLVSDELLRSIAPSHATSLFSPSEGST